MTGSPVATPTEVPNVKMMATETTQNFANSDIYA
jgi:hypothetical protein